MLFNFENVLDRPLESVLSWFIFSHSHIFYNLMHLLFYNLLHLMAKAYFRLFLNVPVDGE